MIIAFFRLLRCVRRRARSHSDPCERAFVPQVVTSRISSAASRRSPRGSYAAAVEGARPAEALKILDAGPLRGGLLQDAVVADEVRAVAARLSECVAGAADSAGASDVVVRENLGDGVEFALRLRDGEVSLWCSAAYSAGSLGPDAGVMALAAVLELDLMSGFKPSILGATRLGDRSKARMRSAWRVQQRGTMSGALEDNVTVVSVADALDEVCGCLWVCHDAVPEGASEALPGVLVPEVEPGSARNCSARTTFCIVPGAPCGNSQEIRLVTSASSWPSSAALAVLEHMPLFALKAMMRWKARELADGFRQHVTSCEALRARTCEQNGLYEVVRRRLAMGWSLAEASPRQGNLTSVTPRRKSEIDAPFDGVWLTQKGSRISIAGSVLRHRGDRVSFALAGVSKCVLRVPSGKYKGDLSPSRTSIVWDDGDVWHRFDGCFATMDQTCDRTAADEQEREIEAIYNEYATSAAF